MAGQAGRTVQMLQESLLRSARLRALIRSARRSESQEYAAWQLLQERTQRRL